MSGLETAPLAEAFGNTIFCDDIRFEVDGKVTLVGTYAGAMYVHTDFPVILAKFCFQITFVQKREAFDPALSVRIFLPGDTDTEASIEADLQPVELPTSDHGGEFHVLRTNLAFAPFQITSPGEIKVRVARRGVLHRIGSLTIQRGAHPAMAAPSSVPSPPA